MSRCYLYILDDENDNSENKYSFYLNLINRISPLYYRTYVKGLKNIKCKNKSVVLRHKNKIVTTYTIFVFIRLAGIYYADVKKSIDYISHSYVDNVEFTVVEYEECLIKEIIESLVMLKHSFYNKTVQIRDKTVIVIDLDDTLIDKTNKFLLTDPNKFFKELYRRFDYVVMWSHGNEEHVFFNLYTHNIHEKFDEILYLTADESARPKGFGRILRLLNEKYNVICTKYTFIIDNDTRNHLTDYKYIIKPPLYSDERFNYDEFYNSCLSKISR